MHAVRFLVKLRSFTHTDSVCEERFRRVLPGSYKVHDFTSAVIGSKEAAESAVS